MGLRGEKHGHDPCAQGREGARFEDHSWPHLFGAEISIQANEDCRKIFEATRRHLRVIMGEKSRAAAAQTIECSLDGNFSRPPITSNCSGAKAAGMS